MSVVVFDIETTGLNADAKFVLGASGGGVGVVDVYYSIDSMANALISTLQRNIPISGHRIISFDLPFLIKNSSRGQELNDVLHKFPHLILDTHVASRMHRGENRGNAMKDWVKYLDLPEQKHEMDWENATPGDYWIRVHIDVNIQKKVTDFFCVKYGPQWKNLPYYHNFRYMFPFISTTLGIGIPLNKSLASRVGLKLKQERANAKMLLYLDMGDVNANSTKQIDKAVRKIYGHGLPIVTKISPVTGKEISNPSFNAKNSADCIRDFPKLQRVKDWREQDRQWAFLKPKGKTSLFEVKNNPTGNRVYPKYSFMSQETYRSSYKEPPINQMDKRVRQLVGHHDYYCVGVDIKSLEFCELAHTLNELFEEDTLLQEISSGVSPKKVTLEVFGYLFDFIPTDKKEEVAKTLNYATIFGQGLEGNRKTLCLDSSYSDAILLARRRRFPGLDDFIRYLADMNKEGFIKNRYGLKIRGMGFKALNYYIQSSGACYAYMILGLYYHYLWTEFPHVLPLLTNHDELQTLIAKKETKVKERVMAVIDKTHNTFEQIMGVPLITKLELTIGDNWKESH